MNQTNTITPYTKRPMSDEDLAALLLSRGLVTDRDKRLRPSGPSLEQAIGRRLNPQEQT